MNEKIFFLPFSIKKYSSPFNINICNNKYTLLKMFFLIYLLKFDINKSSKTKTKYKNKKIINSNF